MSTILENMTRNHSTSCDGSSDRGAVYAYSATDGGTDGNTHGHPFANVIHSHPHNGSHNHDFKLAYCCWLPHDSDIEALLAPLRDENGNPTIDSHAAVRAAGCQNEAEFMLIYGNAPDDYTHSCRGHIGDLIGDEEETIVTGIEYG